jgi:hypothetical protein
LFFLYFCCPFVENSENKQTEIEPSVVIEEKDKEAEVIVKRKKESLKIDQYIYGDILTAEEKKDLCLALAIRFPEGVSEDELAVELSKAVSISPRVREDFLKLIEDKYLRGVRADISKAAESGKIRFEQGAGRWYYVDPLTKKLMDSICRVTSLTEPNIALAEFLLANKEALADFRQSDTTIKEKGGKFVSKKAKDDSTNDKNDIQSGGDN